MQNGCLYLSLNLLHLEQFLIGILNSGDIFIWNKDTDVLRHVEGMKDFAYRLGFHFPTVYVSNDASKMLVVTSRNKVFIFETDNTPVYAIEQLAFLNASQRSVIQGNWKAITAPKDIKTVEDNKELVLSARFNSTIVS